MKISRELKTGIISLAAIAALVFGYNYIKGNNLFSSEENYYVVYDRIDGLTPTRPIVVKGFSIGKVKKVYFSEDYSKVIVEFNLDQEFPVYKESIAKIVSLDIMGAKAIELLPPDSATIALGLNIAQPGDTLKSEIEASLGDQVGATVAPLKLKAEELLGSIDSAVSVVGGFLSDANKENFSKTFESVKNTFQTLENTVDRLDKLVVDNSESFTITMNNISSITSNIKDNEEELSSIFANLSSISDSIAQTNLKQTFTDLATTVKTLNVVVDKIDKGEGTLGLLVNDKELYNNLNASAKSLDELIKDIKENPQDYVNFSVLPNRKRKDKD